MSTRTTGLFTLMAGVPTNVLSDGGVRVARCDFDGDMDHPQAIANAKFFAAAPATLEALKTLRHVLAHVVSTAPGYDWNADPEYLTLMTGAAFAKADEAIANSGDK